MNFSIAWLAEEGLVTRSVIGVRNGRTSCASRTSDGLSERYLFTGLRWKIESKGYKIPFTPRIWGKYMSQIDKLQRLTETQLPQAIAMVGRAFHKDPLLVYVYPDAAERTRRLPLLFSIALRY